jgi:hypothetical protein
VWKLLSALVVFALLSSVVWMGHGLVTGIAIPYPDPTPEQKAYESYHLAISMPLFIVAMVSWLVASATLALCILRLVFRRVVANATNN